MSLEFFAVVELHQRSLDGLIGTLVDALYRSQWWIRPHPDIALIAYDDRSSHFYGGSTKIPVGELENVFSILAKDPPRVVGLLGAFSEKTYTETELKQLAVIFAQLP